ncbi:hypothetical protein HK096_005104, partial [Nowakowskiella sp. JEL0078]
VLKIHSREVSANSTSLPYSSVANIIQRQLTATSGTVKSSQSVSSNSLQLHSTRFVLGSGWLVESDSSADTGMAANLTETDLIEVTASIKNVPAGFYRPIWRVQIIGDSPTYSPLSNLLFKSHMVCDIATANYHPDISSEKRLGENIHSVANRGWFILKTSPMNVGAWTSDTTQKFEVKFQLFSKAVDGSSKFRGLKIDYVSLAPVDAPPMSPPIPAYPPTQTVIAEAGLTRAGPTIAPGAVQRGNTVQMDNENKGGTRIRNAKQAEYLRQLQESEDGNGTGERKKEREYPGNFPQRGNSRSERAEVIKSIYSNESQRHRGPQ